MAGAGKKLAGGGARSKCRSPALRVSDGGFGQPPHPRRIVPGQVFFPRWANGRRRPLEIVAVDGDTARAQRVDPPRRKLAVAVSRLLAPGADGKGCFYVFQGYRPRRYRTWAQVVERQDEEATVVVPEWHPARPVRLPARMLPLGAREPGSWLEASADLSAASAARLGLQPEAACAPPPASKFPWPVWEPAKRAVVRATAEYGAGCGDIVLELAPGGVAARSFFVAERPEGLAPGGRVYVPDGRLVRCYRELERCEPSPNGCRLHCAPEVHRLVAPTSLNGVREDHAWRWRWWPRSAESRPEDLSRWQYRPFEHRGGYVWRRRAAGAPAR